MFYSLDQFEIASKSLGSGTYGDVKMGKAIKNKTKYALKVINTSKLRPAEVKAIEREIQVHRKLEHPNIVSD
jgi:serine/threonine protein kinase